MKLDLPASTRDLEAELTSCGFTRIETGNSHGKWTHPSGAKAVLSRGRKDADRSAARDVRRAIAVTEAIAQGKLDRVPMINTRSMKYDPIDGEEDLYEQALVRAGRKRVPLSAIDASDPIDVIEKTPEETAEYLAAPLDLFPLSTEAPLIANPIILSTLHTLSDALWSKTSNEAVEIAAIEWPATQSGKDLRVFKRFVGRDVYEGARRIGAWADGAWIRSVNRAPVTGRYFKAWCRIGARDRTAGLVWSIEPVKADPSDRTLLWTNDRAEVIAEIDRLDKQVTRSAGEAREAINDKVARRDAIVGPPREASPAPIAPVAPPPVDRWAPLEESISHGGTLFAADRSVQVVYRNDTIRHRNCAELRTTWRGNIAPPEKPSYLSVIDTVLDAFAQEEVTISGIAAQWRFVDVTFGTVPYRGEPCGAVRLSTSPPRMGRARMPMYTRVFSYANLASMLAAYLRDPHSFWSAGALPSFWPDEVHEPFTPGALPSATPVAAPTAPPVVVQAPAPAPTIAPPTPPTTALALDLTSVQAEIEALRAELDTPAIRFVLGRAVTVDDVLVRVVRAGIDMVRASLKG